jgi:hypothetical protein
MFLAFISETSLAATLGQVIIFIAFNTFCLLFQRYRLGLLISYCFVFYWGFIANSGYFIDKLGNTTWGLPIYAVSGACMLLMAVVGFMQGESH